jgi:hypothetical protein
MRLKRLELGVGVEVSSLPPNNFIIKGSRFEFSHSRVTGPILACNPSFENPELGEFAGLQKSVKRGNLGAKKRLFGLKKGQNQGFAVTDSSTGQKCKLFT